jgi:hypothetical protein
MHKTALRVTVACKQPSHKNSPPSLSSWQISALGETALQQQPGANKSDPAFCTGTPDFGRLLC